MCCQGKRCLNQQHLLSQIAETAYQQATLAFEMLQQELALQEGPLLLRLDQLEQALVIQQELEQVQLQIQTAQTQEAEVKSALSQFASGYF